MNKNRKIIWSNHEKYIFTDIIKKKNNIEEELEENDITHLLEVHREENESFLEEQIIKKFDKITENKIIAFAVTYDKNRTRSQLAVELGNNYKDIFDIPFDTATWYVDSWNIKADIEYKGMIYYYTFRILKQEANKKLIENVNQGRPMLTNTYLGHHTKTILRK